MLQFNRPTVAESLSVARFNASLPTRGVELFGRTGKFQCLIEWRSEIVEFETGDDTRQTPKIHMLRSSSGATELRPGDVLVNRRTGQTFTLGRRESEGSVKFVFSALLLEPVYSELVVKPGDWTLPTDIGGIRGESGERIVGEGGERIDPE